MPRKEPLYPHVPKSKMVEGLHREFPHIGGKPPVSKTTREEEQTIVAAQDVIRQLQQLRPQLDKMYARVKYNMPEWAGPRNIAADFVNAAGALEFELTEKIRTIRSRR